MDEDGVPGMRLRLRLRMGMRMLRMSWPGAEDEDQVRMGIMMRMCLDDADSDLGQG